MLKKKKRCSDFDDFDLVYPDDPPPPFCAPPLAISAPPLHQEEVFAELPFSQSQSQSESQPKPIKPRLTIRLPSRRPSQSPTKADSASFTASDSSATRNLFVSTPLSSVGSSNEQTPVLPQYEQTTPFLRLCSNAGCNGIVRFESNRRRCMGCITRGWTSKDFLSHTESDRETAKIQKRKKKSRKRVSWFDGYGEDEKQAVECTEPESALGDGSGEDAMDVDEVDLDRPMLEMDSDHSNSDVFIRGWDSDLTEEDEDKDDRVHQEMTADQDTDPGPSFGLSRKRCSITSCRNFLPLYDARKCCPSCRETDRERRRKRLCNIRTGKYSEYGPDESKDQESLSLKLASSHNQLKSYTLDDPAGFVAAGARLCSISGCKHIVPNQVEYKYKLCFPCRCRSSRNHKIQQARRDRQIRAASGLTIDEDEEPIEVFLFHTPS
ncbi:hypothetical protein EV361DRAFT_522544 [Lentinula raphanica]|nr:hypothetical protein EV361DRAFT_522544 [Lentinula raphanica]